MKVVGALLATLLLFSYLPIQSQQDITIKTLDQKFFIRDNGVVESIWKVTARVEKKTEAFSFYLNFGTKSYIRDLVVLGPKQQPLKTQIISSESLPLFNVIPPVPLEKEEFSFTVRFVIWEAVTTVGNNSSFDFATGFLYPIEGLDLLISSPPTSRILDYFPGGGEPILYNNLPAVKWNLTSIPAGKNLQIKLEYSRVTSQEADTLFGDALSLFNAKNWESSQEKFSSAMEEYTLLGDKKRAEECTTYIGKIKDILVAGNLVAEATTFSSQEKFSEAVPKYRQAKFLYNRAGMTEEATKLGEAIERTTKYETAQENVTQARNAEQRKEYGVASGFYKTALRIYTELGDETKVEEINKNMSNLKPSPLKNLFTAGIIIILLLVAIIAYLVVRRKPAAAPTPQPAPTPSETPPSDKKKAEVAGKMQTCPFCGREIPKSETICPHCSNSLLETKEELQRRKEETQKTIDELEKSYIGGLISEEEYKKLRKKWVTLLADIEEKIISYEVKKGR
jgi:tetratricopeptide (TPR) repeat protein